MSRNRVIGRRGVLPWRMPADMHRFKRRTMGHSVIMGRKTWTGMNDPLPGRTNIVITRDAAFHCSGAIAVHSMEDAWIAANKARPGAGEIFVIGGAEIYRLALPFADRIDLTVIDLDIDDGDAFFPEVESDPAWRLESEERHAADEKNPYAYAFKQYQRLGIPREG